jgi:hypothetical protein
MPFGCVVKKLQELGIVVRKESLKNGNAAL